MYIKKQHRKSRQTKLSKFRKRVRAICNLVLCYNFALLLHENALVFSQSEARNFFFMYIVNMVPWNTPKTPLLMLETKINSVAV